MNRNVRPTFLRAVCIVSSRALRLVLCGVFVCVCVRVCVRRFGMPSAFSLTARCAWRSGSVYSHVFVRVFACVCDVFVRRLHFLWPPVVLGALRCVCVRQRVFVFACTTFWSAVCIFSCYMLRLALCGVCARL